MPNVTFNIEEIYAENVFNDSAMRKYLPGDTYKTLKKTIDSGYELDASIADIVANGMKQWALALGATHYTHWFQPMTGTTAEKHDSFINPMGDGSVLMTFSGKELIRGESDASSFPSGGLRVTFEARGYTAWDCTSPAFIKENTLCIPTCFCSYTGEVLDKKTPLLRSMEILSNAGTRVVNALGFDKAARVVPMAGAEQEYFLIDKSLFLKRRDLLLCGRTLMGARSQKGQELDDHYYGNMRDRVLSYMREVDEILWRLGVAAKTEHNEAAPAQHELAPVYTTANIACDNNQLIMETLKKTALRRDMVCLLHEKPFAGLNGSGKHNNWSMSIDGTKNLLKQGKNPREDLQFLLFLSAVIWAVDEYAPLLRATIASAGNDHRLGGNEAPPAIVSIFLGDELTQILQNIESGDEDHGTRRANISMGVSTMPDLYADTSDRNRTSPFAFTGNKFEFRMPGASQSIADCNAATNTIVAEILGKIADRLESATDTRTEAICIIADIMREHKRVIFNGNNYSAEWVKEAERRGLPNIRTSVDAIGGLTLPKVVSLFEKHNILTQKELESRAEIRYAGYAKTLSIECGTMLEMVRGEIMPAVMEYQSFLADGVHKIQVAVGKEPKLQSDMMQNITMELHYMYERMQSLEKGLAHGTKIAVAKEKAQFFSDVVAPAMEDLRAVCDRCESIMPKKMYPIPTYTDLLHNI